MKYFHRRVKTKHKLFFYFLSDWFQVTTIELCHFFTFFWWEIRRDQKQPTSVSRTFSFFHGFRTFCRRSLGWFVRVNECEGQKSVRPAGELEPQCQRLKPRHPENIHHNTPTWGDNQHCSLKYNQHVNENSPSQKYKWTGIHFWKFASLDQKKKKEQFLQNLNLQFKS